MLTKQDLEAIDNLVVRRVNPLEKQINDFREEASREFRKLNKEINRIERVLKSFTRHFDQYLQTTRKKVSKIEDFLKIPSA